VNYLSIIDKIYENKNFTTIFLVAIFALALIFIIVLILGLKDAKKAKNPKKEIKEEDVKDVSFELPTKKEQEDIKEDVTFELPVLTDDLENFKKNLEEEIKKDEEIKVTKNNSKELEVATRPIKILDIKEIEDTKIIDTKEIKKQVKKTKEEEQPKQKEVELPKHKAVEKVVKESKYNSKDNF